MKAPKERKKTGNSRKDGAKSKRAVVESMKEVVEGGSESLGNGDPVSEMRERTPAPSVTDPAPMVAESAGGGIESFNVNAKAEAELPRDLIAARAYELYLARGCVDGHHLEDWLTAEREIRLRYNHV